MELASRTVLGELWRAGPPLIERVIWWAPIRRRYSRLGALALDSRHSAGIEGARSVRNQELRAYSYSPRGDLRLLPGDLHAWVTRFGSRPKSSKGSRRDEAKAASEEANAV
jgi:hypothetical protein